jgi:hypothetical protein
MSSIINEKTNSVYVVVPADALGNLGPTHRASSAASVAPNTGVMTAFSVGLSASMRSIAAVTSSTAVMSPQRISSACAVALSVVVR